MNDHDPQVVKNSKQEQPNENICLLSGLPSLHPDQDHNGSSFKKQETHQICRGKPHRQTCKLLKERT